MNREWIFPYSENKIFSDHGFKNKIKQNKKFNNATSKRKIYSDEFHTQKLSIVLFRILKTLNQKVFLGTVRKKKIRLVKRLT